MGMYNPIYSADKTMVLSLDPNSEAFMHPYIIKLESILAKANVCASHGIQHAIAVKDHALHAIEADAVTLKNNPDLVGGMWYVVCLVISIFVRN